MSGQPGKQPQTLPASGLILLILALLGLGGCRVASPEAPRVTLASPLPSRTPTLITSAPALIEPENPATRVGHQSPDASTPSPSRMAPTLAPGANGAIESLTLITRTANSEYYALVYWSDGYRVTGFLGRPRAAGVYPAIIYNRGGYQEYGALEGWEVSLFVEAGYVAVASQYRGNAGSEGQEEHGGADVNDVMNLIPLLKQFPDVDPDRLGMMGHSRGGMMTYLALKQETLAGTHDIKAAVTVGGVSDAFMLVQETPFFLQVFGASPQADPALYQARSATYWPELINAPLLIQHGEADSVVSVEQSRQLARALQAAGKTVKLVTFAGEEHELPEHYGGMPEALAWFQQYLADQGQDYTFQSHKAAIREMMTWFQTHYRNR